MTIKVNPSTTQATPHDRLVARAWLRLPVQELPNVRATALAWRNGLAALMAGLVGFSLIKGRSEIGQLATPWPVVVGILLAVCLLAGAAAAALLLRAAHGPPGSRDAEKLMREVANDPLGSVERVEALASAKALTRGVRLAYACALFLVLAVGTTWYGPGKPALLRVEPGGDTHCGEVQELSGGTLVLKTSAGTVRVLMDQATGIKAVDQCP